MPEKSRRPALGFFTLLIACLVILIATDLFSPKPKSSPASAAKADPDANTGAASSPAPPPPKWNYSAVDMDAGAKHERVGCIQSEEMVSLQSPYSNTYARLCFRTDGTALFSIGDGQLLSGEGHGARVRIGDSAPRSFSLEEPSDYSHEAAFLGPASPLFSAAKAAKKITVQATYYEAGSQTVTFLPDSPLSLKAPQ